MRENPDKLLLICVQDFASIKLVKRCCLPEKFENEIFRKIVPARKSFQNIIRLNDH